MTTVISVENLTKRYTISHRQGEDNLSLREALSAALASVTGRILHPLRPSSDTSPRSEVFSALEEVSFRVELGERVGIIGRNGAGKSTLLKILSRITEPSAGCIRIRGRVASLLEVGTGFHPELTGRENIYLNGAILGMSRQEIRRKFDEIVQFSEIERFLDTPVKRYSSGMYVRLAFAVAAHLEPEILIVDEVLAVGDAQFQKKCLGKMEQAGKQGQTVLFVSHNMGAVAKLCNRAILLDAGRAVLDGQPDKVIKRYLDTGREQGKLKPMQFEGSLTRVLEFRELRINGTSEDHHYVSPSSEITITVRGCCREAVPNFRTTFSIFAEDSRLLTQHDTESPETLQQGEFQSEIAIPACLLRPGEYSIAIGGYRDGMNEWIWGTYLRYFTVAEEWEGGNDPCNFGLVNVPFKGKRIRLKGAA